MKYIITLDMPKDSPISNQLLYVLTSQQISEYQSEGFNYRERIYNKTINSVPTEIVCGEIWKEGDIEHSVIIPAFLIPNRPYSLEVYVYALNYYCGNYGVSQRAAAEATRKEYKLKKFSHTTIGRAMQTLSRALEEIEVKTAPGNVTTDNNCVTADSKSSKADASDTPITENKALPEISTKSASGMCVRREEQREKCSKHGSIKTKSEFPAVKDTIKRRELIKAFFIERVDIHIRQGFREACGRIAEWWHTKYYRLLI
jgi:hypothetical protein